jgi:hypothetical protein
MEDAAQLGLDPYAALRGGIKPPLSEEDWKKRMQLMRDLGFKEDGAMMRGTEWRRGLAHDRDEFRNGVASSIRRGLGFKDDETDLQLGAAAAAGAPAAKRSL